MSSRRRALFLALTLLTPLLLLAALECVLRLTWPAGALPAFDQVGSGDAHFLIPGRRVSRRYFADEAFPPVPPTDLFAAERPARHFRVFVLGESTAAGFPYPANGTFSRVVRDALRDVLPDDSVEVVNLGIAATNSYTLLDLVPDVIDQHPDAVLIYAGHNEFYGALGVGSSVRAGSHPALIRAYLHAERFRTVMLLRSVITAVRRSMHSSATTDPTAASFMESVVADQRIDFGGATYDAGLAQFSGNLSRVLQRLHDAGVPAFVASIASNVRDQPPFVSEANAPARAAFDSARTALARGDSANARRLYVRARDLDVIRFRAPSALDDTIRAIASRTQATYVPVAERFDSASSGMPGSALFLEHVHPNQHGYALIGQSFFETLAAKRFLGHAAQLSHLDDWAAYERRMALSPFDNRIVEHTVRTVTTRWPFVSRDKAVDYRGSYRVTGFADSLALVVARGGDSWADAKQRLGAHYEAAGYPDSAEAEYRGLVRDRPFIEGPNRMLGRALVAEGRYEDAAPVLERALRLAQHPETYYLLGRVALARRDFPQAITMLDRSVTLAPNVVEPLYQLSLAFGLSHNIVPARAAAARAAQLDPHHPGLAAWMATLGMRAP